jgi:glutamine amidotransferase
MNVAIVDYGSGNLRSAAKAFERAAFEGGIPVSVAVTANPSFVADADRIVLPGVGAFAACLGGLNDLPGMRAALRTSVLERGRPFLGICVGMQLMASRGLEHGEHRGLGWIEGEVAAIEPDDAGLKVPHMGWNDLCEIKPHPVFEGLADGAHAYFVHSYCFRPASAVVVQASVDYGGRFAAVVGRDNMVGTQFHPEKSQSTGLRIIQNFLRWKP